MIARPEVRDGILRAGQWLARERSNDVHEVTLTRLVNDLIFEEWGRMHPGMMFPSVDGEVMPIECTPSLVKT